MVKLDVIVTGRLPMPHAYAFRSEGRGGRLGRILGVLRPGGEVLDSPCLAYVVRHPSAGAILIDTGFHPIASESLREEFGTRMALLFRGLRPSDTPYEEELRELGVDPSAVERVVMTHLHADHTSGMRLLPTATFVCAREEWAAATRSSAGDRGYVEHHLPPADRMELVDFDAAGEPHGPFPSTIDLLGDGCILLIATPGHTAGHMSVLLRVEGGRHVVVVGDAVYTLRSLREEILPLLTLDDETYLRSVRALKAFAAQELDATFVPTHDPTAWRELPGAARVPIP